MSIVGSRRDAGAAHRSGRGVYVGVGAGATTGQTHRRKAPLRLRHWRRDNQHAAAGNHQFGACLPEEPDAVARRPIDSRGLFSPRLDRRDDRSGAAKEARR
jgi:hypothetical protein